MKELYEVNKVFVAQKDPGLETRWFRGEEGDLTIWQNLQEEIVHFQLSLGVAYVEWDKEKGLKTGIIDEGESSPLENRSPIVQYDLHPNWKLITHMATRFEDISFYIDKKVRNFVLQTLDRLEATRDGKF